jgi:hypothetical protein
MDYIKHLQISNIINYFFNKQSEEPTNEKVIKMVEYKDFMIEDDDNKVKGIIDKFHEVCDNIKDTEIEYKNSPNLNIKESLYSLDILTSRTDIMEYLATNNNDYTNEVVSVISKLYLNIIKKQNEIIDNEVNIIKKAQYNFNLCEIIIKYNFVFNHPAFSKYFIELWRHNIKKYYLAAKNDGCVISWITLAILCPLIVNNKCYPIINKEADLYKKINWDYIKSKVYFEKYFKLFFKYYID